MVCFLRCVLCRFAMPDELLKNARQERLPREILYQCTGLACACLAQILQQRTHLQCCPLVCSYDILMLFSIFTECEMWTIYVETDFGFLRGNKRSHSHENEAPRAPRLPLDRMAGGASGGQREGWPSLAGDVCCACRRGSLVVVALPACLGTAWCSAYVYEFIPWHNRTAYAHLPHIGSEAATIPPLPPLDLTHYHGRGPMRTMQPSKWPRTGLPSGSRCSRLPLAWPMRRGWSEIHLPP